MMRRNSMMILPAVILTFVLAIAGQSQADWSLSFQGEVGRSYSPYSGDRITSEYRRGYQVDDWVERGASSVTESPFFADGIRLASWSTGHDDDYEYGVASAIYFFEISPRARSVRIKISYDGEAERSDFDDDIAGRVWIRRTSIGDDYEEYYPRDGRYEDVDEPLYGDTFVLRARKSLEILRLPADDYVDDGMMEIHIVAEGRQRVDVKSIEVETYSYAPKVRVITRYYRDYNWQPWNNYAYWYFYTGPVYHFGDYYYVRYTYPRYHHNYIEIRRRFNNYLTGYYVRNPRHHHVRWTYVGRVPRGTRRTWNKGRLNRWTSNHDEARKSYAITSAKQRNSVDVRKSRTRIRGVLSSSSHRSPSTTRALSGSPVRASIRRDKTSTPTRSSSTSDVKRRATTPDVRRGTDRTRSSTTAPSRVESQSSTKSRRVETKTPVRTRPSSTSRRTEPERNVKRETPTRSAPQQQRRTAPSSGQVKTRQENAKSRQPEVKRAEPQRRAPARKVETKKEDDDDDDDDEKKSSSSSTKTRSSSSSSGSSSSSSSSKTRKTR